MCIFFTMNVYKVTNAHMAKMEKLKPTGLSRQNEWANKSKWSYLYSYWIQFRQSLDPVNMDCLQGHMYTPVLPSLLNISVECSKRQFISEKGMSPHPASCLFVALKAVELASHTEWLSKRWNRPLVGGLHTCLCFWFPMTRVLMWYMNQPLWYCTRSVDVECQQMTLGCLYLSH